MKKSIRFISELLELNINFRVLHHKNTTSIKILKGRVIKDRVTYLPSGMIQVNDDLFNPGTPALFLLKELGYYTELEHEIQTPPTSIPETHDLVPPEIAPSPDSVPKPPTTKRKMRRTP
jgi:hypothetical protein